MIGDTTDMLARIKATIPPRWFASTTPGLVASTPVLDGLLNGPAWLNSWLYDLLQYVAAQRRITTASSFNLDLIARDFFGNLYQRIQGEFDDSYRARIKANLFAPKATRAAVIAAVTALTGIPPVVFEPRNPSDTGGWGHLGMTQGTGLGYGVAGGYGSLLLPFQAFVKAFRPHGGGIASVGGYYGFGSGLPAFGGYGVGSLEYVGRSMIPASITDDVIYATIADTAPVATILWTAITNNTGSSQVAQSIVGRLQKQQASQTISAGSLQGATFGGLTLAQAIQTIVASAVRGAAVGRLTIAQAAQIISASASLTVTFNPFDQSVGITLSGGNLTATTISGVGSRVWNSDFSNDFGPFSGLLGIRSTAFISVNTYIELTINSALLSERYGLATASWVESATSLGGDLHSISFDAAGVIRINGGQVAIASPLVPGDVLAMSVNPATQKAWFRRNNDPWSSPDPAITGSHVVGASGPLITVPVQMITSVGRFSGLASSCSVADSIWPHAGNATMTVSSPVGAFTMNIGGVPVPGSGVGNSVTVTDTDAHLRSALTTLAYLPPSSGTSDVITIVVTDQLGQSNTATIPVTLNPQSDPVSGGGGIDLSALGGIPLFVAVGTNANGLNVTANFGAAPFYGTAPGGYNSMNGATAPSGSHAPPTPPSNLVSSNETGSSVTLSWAPSSP